MAALWLLSRSSGFEVAALRRQPAAPLIFYFYIVARPGRTISIHTLPVSIFASCLRPCFAPRRAPSFSPLTLRLLPCPSVRLSPRPPPRASPLPVLRLSPRPLRALSAPACLRVPPGLSSPVSPLALRFFFPPPWKTALRCTAGAVFTIC